MIATTRGALLRGSTTDALGDEIENDTAEEGHFETIPATYTPWAEQRRNIFPDPKARTLDPGTWGTGGFQGPLTTTTDPDGTTWVRSNRTGSGASRLIDLKAGLAFGGTSVLHRVRMRLRAAVDVPAVNIVYRAAVAVNASAVTIRATATLPAGETLIDATFATSASVAPTATAGIVLVQTSSAFDGVEVTDVHIEQLATYAPPPPPLPIAGDNGVTELSRYRWEAAANASPSIFETRAVDVPAHEEYVVDKPSGFVAGAGDFPVSIIERSRREFDEASNAWRTVRYFAGRCSTKIPVKAGDRIRDHRDGAIYNVSEVKRTARGLSGRGSVTLTMKRTSP